VAVSPAQFAALTPGLEAAKRALYLPLLTAAAAQHGITTPVRLSAFVAQLLHESAGLQYFEELWGPTPAQERYEGRVDLGNTEPGDGKRFKGRGPIQITGRANYARYGKLLGLPLEQDPALAATPAVGFAIAGLYWVRNGLNELADRNTLQSFKQITKRINGGFNGLEDRVARWRLAQKVLA
jgi:putative chitinase